VFRLPGGLLRDPAFIRDPAFNRSFTVLVITHHSLACYFLYGVYVIVQATVLTTEQTG